MSARGLLPLRGDQGARKGMQFGIDWFAFTVKDQPMQAVKRRLVTVFGDEWRSWELIRRGERRQREIGPFGTLIEVDWVERWVHVQVKGQGCRAVGTPQVLRLFDYLVTTLGEACLVKRVDLAWDDFEKRLPPPLLRERFWDALRKAKRPEVMCRAKRGHFREDDAAEGGCSYTIGERVSKRMLRVYDKAAQSRGKVDAIRMELVCSEEVAHRACVVMAGSAGQFSGAALGFLVGFLDFRGGRGRRA
ncbi:MAG: replication initiation factor domain-containing protein [Planctomycetota bacterium]